MKISKAGIKMYESNDPLPKGTHLEHLAMMINLLREEVNKIAIIIDNINQKIEKE